MAMRQALMLSRADHKHSLTLRLRPRKKPVICRQHISSRSRLLQHTLLLQLMLDARPYKSTTWSPPPRKQSARSSARTVLVTNRPYANLPYRCLLRRTSSPSLPSRRSALCPRKRVRLLPQRKYRQRRSAKSNLPDPIPRRLECRSLHLRLGAEKAHPSILLPLLRTVLALPDLTRKRRKRRKEHQ